MMSHAHIVVDGMRIEVGTTTLVLPAAHVVHPRIDLVVRRPDDKVVVLAGVPSAFPIEPIASPHLKALGVSLVAVLHVPAAALDATLLRCEACGR